MEIFSPEKLHFGIFDSIARYARQIVHLPFLAENLIETENFVNRRENKMDAAKRKELERRIDTASTLEQEVEILGELLDLMLWERRIAALQTQQTIEHRLATLEDKAARNALKAGTFFERYHK